MVCVFTQKRRLPYIWNEKRCAESDERTSSHTGMDGFHL